MYLESAGFEFRRAYGQSGWVAIPEQEVIELDELHFHESYLELKYHGFVILKDTKEEMCIEVF